MKEDKGKNRKMKETLALQSGSICKGGDHRAGSGEGGEGGWNDGREGWFLDDASSRLKSLVGSIMALKVKQASV